MGQTEKREIDIEPFCVIRLLTTGKDVIFRPCEDSVKNSTSTS